MRKLKNEELGRMDAESFKSSEKIPVIIVLDSIRSMHNVGSAFRTGDAFRIEKILLTGITGRPPHREINKVALGATETVDWKYHETVLDAVNVLKQSGYNIIVIEQVDKSQSLTNFNWSPNEKYALIFGNEVFGVSDQVIPESDVVLEIPQFGSKHSLNVSVSVGVVLWDYMVKIQPF